METYLAKKIANTDLFAVEEGSINIPGQVVCETELDKNYVLSEETNEAGNIYILYAVRAVLKYTTVTKTGEKSSGTTTKTPHVVYVLAPKATEDGDVIVDQDGKSYSVNIQTVKTITAIASVGA